MATHEMQPGISKALLTLFAVVTCSTGDADQGGGEILFVNDLFCALSGWTREQIIGQKLNVIIPERSREAHEHYRKGFEARPAARPMGPDRQVVLLHKEGHEIRVWVGLDPDFDPDTGLVTVTSVMLPMDIGRPFGLPHSMRG